MFTEIKSKIHGNTRCVATFILATVLIALNGCVYDPVYYGPPSYTEYHPDFYDYYYYPSVGVYFQFTTGYYYYRSRDIWVQTRQLPPNIYIDPRDRITIRIESDKPYLRHDEQVQGFRPDVKLNQPEVDKEQSRKEREANLEWYQKYEQRSERPERDKRDDEKEWNKKKVPR